MSGGKLDYSYRHLNNLAEEIKERLENKQIHSKFTDELTKAEQRKVLAEINKIVKDLNSLVERAKNLEWWLSGDSGERDYLESITKKTAPLK